MKAELTLLNLKNNKEKEFNLPNDLKDIKEFLNNGKYGYKITNVEDTHNFLMDIQAYEYTYKEINELVKMIENTSNIKETITKLSFHCDTNSNDIKNLTNHFENILDKYEIYENYSTPEEWVEVYNERYKFIDTTDINTLYRNFDSDLKDKYFRDLTATYDLKKWEEKIYKVSFKEAFDFLNECNLLLNPNLSIIGYLDWKIVIRELRASGFYIDKYKDFIIVYNG